MSDLNPEEIRDALRADMRKRWKTELQNREKSAPKNKPRPLRWIVWAVAATIALLISLALWLGRDTMNDEELFANYFEAPLNTFTSTQRGENDNSGILSAMQAYEARDYDLTLALFQEQPDSLLSDGASFYRGVAALATGKIVEARQYLNEASQGSYQRSVEWFLALCDLKEAKYTQCRIQLEEITAKEDHPYANSASDLLLRLSK
ncbi:MAG: hypothetical protein AAF242_16270 [Bacteroidota bacterium]